MSDRLKNNAGKYAEKSGEPVNADVVKMPFTTSVNLNIREKIDS